MIQIDRLRMRLPRGFEHRATTIARLVGEELARKHLTQSQVLDSVAVAPERISLNTTDAEIASRIVEEILASVEGKKR